LLNKIRCIHPPPPLAAAYGFKQAQTPTVEMMNLTKQQLQQQSGMAMSAQSRQRVELFVGLLR
jgi:hypothetical protein